MHHSSNNNLPKSRQWPLFGYLIGMTALVAITYLYFVDIPVHIELIFFALFVVATGIPHGAVDHIVAADVYKLNQNFKDQLKFYGTYLIVMACLGALWIVSPISGFVVFMITSIYHFGQGDLNWVSSSLESKTYLRALFVSRGIMLIVIPVVYHWQVTAPIIESASGFDITYIHWLVDHALYIAVIALLQHMMLMLGLIGKIKTRFIVQEYSLVIILAFLFFIANPLVSFALYFGIWHSLNHFFELRDHLSLKNNSTDSFFNLYKHTVPFTIISLIGLVLLWYILGAAGVKDQMISVLFILISVLTLPHMLLINQMYDKKI